MPATKLDRQKSTFQLHSQTPSFHPAIPSRKKKPDLWPRKTKTTTQAATKNTPLSPQKKTLHAHRRNHILKFEHCLFVGHTARSTVQKTTKYLLGTRGPLEIFKLHELRYLLLRIYPLIHTLFSQARVQLQLTQKAKKNFNFAAKGTQDHVLRVTHPNLPPQVLFATTTPAFATIISHAAKICNMPYHQQRWLNGSITGAISYLFDHKLWSNMNTRVSKNTIYFFRQQWGQNKENWAKSEEKARYYNRSRWPSLVIIPDIVNNDMILSEIQKVGLPVIGLVNSNCSFEIEYPIFAQDQTFASVHFFCHFLATLIAKEMTFWQHKAHIKKKAVRQKNTSKKGPFFASTTKSVLSAKDKSLSPMDSFLFNSFILAKKTAKKGSKHKRDAFRLQPFTHIKKRQDFSKQESIGLTNIKPWWQKEQAGQMTKEERKAAREKRQAEYEKRKLKREKKNARKRHFRRIGFYWEMSKRSFSLNARFPHLWQLRQKLRQPMLHKPFVWNVINEEAKEKFLAKGSPKISVSLQQNLRLTKLLPHFVALPKQIRLFWQHKLLAQNLQKLEPKSYYWLSLTHLVDDLKWGIHKPLTPKMWHFVWKKKLKQRWYQQKKNFWPKYQPQNRQKYRQKNTGYQPPMFQFGSPFSRANVNKKKMSKRKPWQTAQEWQKAMLKKQKWQQKMADQLRPKQTKAPWMQQKLQKRQNHAKRRKHTQIKKVLQNEKEKPHGLSR